MKCVNCGSENKDAAKACRKCGRDLAVPPAWFPSAAWHMKTLGIVYACLIALYFCVSAALSRLPRPYQLRHIPMEMTPWLNPNGKAFVPEDQLKAPALPPEEAQKR